MQSEERYALEEIKKFALLNIIAFIIILVGLLAIPAITEMANLLKVVRGDILTLPTSSIDIIFVIPLAGLVISIIALFKLYRGFKDINYIDNRFCLPYKGVILLIVGFILAIISITIIPIFLSVNINTSRLIVVPLIISMILIIIGFLISHTIGFIRLKDRYNKSSFTIAAILFIIHIIALFMPLGNIIADTPFIPLGFIPIINIIAYVILYRTLNGILKV